MKLNIQYNNKEYTLSFTRASARYMANQAASVKDKEDVVENAGFMIRSALRAEQPKLSENEASEVVGYILDNCQLVDAQDGDKTEKGLLSYLNEMVMKCMPKGFTGQTATKGFTVVE